MNRMQIGGVILFLVALAGFVLYLPMREESRSPDESSLADGNKSPSQSVIHSETPNSVLQAPARSKGVRGMEIEMADLSEFDVGDEISLYIPQEDQSYTGRVSEVNITTSGNRVMTGFLNETAGKHRFIFTVGAYQTFGTIRTNAGSYQLETREGAGRIISVATINEGLDFSQPDFVVPIRKELPPETTGKGNG